jgi:hypothetical protein
VSIVLPLYVLFSLRTSYSRMAREIYNNPNDRERELAKNIIGLIVSAKRSLKWHEIQSVLSINVDDMSVNFDGRSLCADTRDLFGSLVKMGPDNTVQFVHRTARRYVTPHQLISIAPIMLTMTS